MEVKRTKAICIDLVLVILLLAFDQFTKHLAIVKLKGQSPHVLIDGVLEFQYLENRGAAFGMFQNQKLGILVIGCILVGVIGFLICKLPPQKKFISVHILLSFVVAGGIGNMIDRVRFDFVVDFISFVLIDYPIFNVADCYIVCGMIILCILFIFVFKEEDLNFLSFKRNRNREIK